MILVGFGEILGLTGGLPRVGRTPFVSGMVLGVYPTTSRYSSWAGCCWVWCVKIWFALWSPVKLGDCSEVVDIIWYVCCCCCAVIILGFCVVRAPPRRFCCPPLGILQLCWCEALILRGVLCVYTRWCCCYRRTRNKVVSNFGRKSTVYRLLSNFTFSN